MLLLALLPASSDPCPPQALKDAEDEVRKIGPMTVLAGTGAPHYWTSAQNGEAGTPKKEFEAVALDKSCAVWGNLQMCLEGHDVGAGGRDAVSGKKYNHLELGSAWRIENSTVLYTYVVWEPSANHIFCF